MPGIYRAPEVILGMEWDYKVDIWSIGNMVWDLAEDHHLFFAKENGTLSDEQHLAEMVSLMGPPPPEFLMRSKRCERFWDAEGYFDGFRKNVRQQKSLRKPTVADGKRVSHSQIKMSTALVRKKEIPSRPLATDTG
ncbi:hypothetical protein AtubIFM57143_008406 [Aspergillus tubingensis]|nr:hypothetical protein AtubIFM57143_008406 [Aspergillus tubingensis]